MYVWATRCRRNLYGIFWGKNVFRFNNLLLPVVPVWDTGINFTLTLFFQDEKTYIHTLTIYMEQSPLEADSFSASQAIPSILLNLKVCYQFPLLPILSKKNLDHTHPSYLRTILKLPSHPCQGLDNGTNTWNLPCQIRAGAVRKCIFIKYKSFYSSRRALSAHNGAICVDLIEICGNSLIENCMYPTMPVLVAAWSKVWVCGRLPSEIVGSNPAGGTFVC